MFGYAVSDVDVREIQEDDQATSRFRIACAETRCGEGNCAVRIEIHTQLAKDKRLETARAAISGWNFKMLERTCDPEEARGLILLPLAGLDRVVIDIDIPLLLVHSLELRCPWGHWPLSGESKSVVSYLGSLQSLQAWSSNSSIGLSWASSDVL